jgi:transcription elongation factor GreA
MNESSSTIGVGSHVRIRDEDGEVAFRIVESLEADASVDRVSAESPIGRALIGRRVGDLINYRAPGGVLTVTVVGVG